MNSEYRADIDGLRAVAVVLVVVFHAFPTVLGGGFVGVDVFFVISGYLITGIILSDIGAGNFTFSRFYARRVRRILPALAVVLAAVLAIGWLLLLPATYQSLGLHTVAGALFFPNLLSWKEVGYFDAAAELKPLLHLWSLGVEEQFYLVWPLVLLVLGRRRGWLTLGLFVLVAVSFLYSCFAARHQPAAAFYSPLSRLWELGVGGILASTNWRLKGGNVLSLSGIALIVGSAVLLKKTDLFPGGLALLPVAGSALVIISGSRILGHKWPVSLGLISYPLYLWHWPLLSFAAIAGVTSIPAKMGLVAASFGLAYGTKALVERPLRFGRLRKISVPLSLAAMTLVVGCAALIWGDGGLLWRYPTDIRPVLTAMQFVPGSGARANRCWLDKDSPFEKYVAECGVGATLIWGDSHAARLYVGLKTEGTEIAQFTRDSCPPILDGGEEACARSNAAILQAIAKLKPKKVILFAVWGSYQNAALPSGGLADTLRQLKAIVNDVVVIGPAPHWTPDLPVQVYNSWRLNGSLPDRLSPDPLAYHMMDDRLAALSASAHVRFASPFDALCNSDGCLTHTPQSRAELLSWDYGHLTNAGAKLLVVRLHLN
jgi:peptidoglycan/LPS O-acetylase OafA/YrhL